MRIGAFLTTLLVLSAAQSGAAGNASAAKPDAKTKTEVKAARDEITVALGAHSESFQTLTPPENRKTSRLWLQTETWELNGLQTQAFAPEGAQQYTSTIPGFRLENSFVLGSLTPRLNLLGRISGGFRAMSRTSASGSPALQRLHLIRAQAGVDADLGLNPKRSIRLNTGVALVGALGIIPSSVVGPEGSEKGLGTFLHLGLEADLTQQLSARIAFESLRLKLGEGSTNADGLSLGVGLAL